MKFRSKEDIDVPVEHVFDMLTDFDRHERSAMRRGAEVERIVQSGSPGPAWRVCFDFRGKRRETDLEIMTLDRPNELGLNAVVSGMTMVIRFELIALSRRKTRLLFKTELSPKTLSARLFVQSMRLAKGNLQKRLDGRVQAHAREIERRFRDSP